VDVCTEAAGDPEEGAARLHGGVREAGGGPEEELRGVPGQVPLSCLPRATGSIPHHVMSCMFSHLEEELWGIIADVAHWLQMYLIG